MGRGFRQSVVIGCATGLSVAAIDGATGFVVAGMRFMALSFAAASAGLTALLVLAAFLTVRWLLVEPLMHRGAANGPALSIATGMGVAALFVSFDVGTPPSSVAGLLALLVDLALGVAVGAGAYALAVGDARQASMTPSRLVGRALPFVMTLALVAAWFAFVRADSVMSIQFALIVLVLVIALVVASRVASALSPGRWSVCVVTVFGIVAAGGVAGAFVLGGDGTLTTLKGKKQRGSVSRVILLTVDTLRRDALSCYGSSTVSTPNIDRIATRGTLFKNATSSSSWTLPAVASMMTGLGARAHGVVMSTAMLPDTVATLAERFREAGYATSALVANGILAPHRGFAQGFQRYYLPVSPVQPVSIGEFLATRFRYEPLTNGTSTRDITNTAIAWTRAHKDQDFFLWIHYLDPHLPYAPPEAYVERMDVHSEMGFRLDITSATRPSMDLFSDVARRLWARSLYDGEVRYVDAEIGRLLNAFEKMGVYDDALVVFGADHGEEFWDHDGFEHGHTLYNELIGVPLIVKTPGARKPRIVKDPVTIDEVTPTVLELCGLPPVVTPDSISLSGYLAGSRQPARVIPVFASGTLFNSNFECVMFEGWKYIHSDTSGREELFRLADDPLEQRSLVVDYPDVAARGRKLIGDRINAMEAFRAMHGISNPMLKLDAEEIERLRTLGYL